MFPKFNDAMMFVESDYVNGKSHAYGMHSGRRPNPEPFSRVKFPPSEKPDHPTKRSVGDRNSVADHCVACLIHHLQYLHFSDLSSL